MTDRIDDSTLADLADGTLGGPEWEAWLAQHPHQAAEVELARRVRALLDELRASEVEVPAGFEERLLARVREDAALRDLLDLGLAGLGRVLIDLLNALLSLLPSPAPAPTAA